MFALQQRIDVEAKRQFYRLASGPRRGNDDDTAGGRFRRDKRVAIRRQGAVDDIAERRLVRGLLPAGFLLRLADRWSLVAGQEGGFRFVVAGRPRAGVSPFASPLRPGGKMTRALGGLFRIAVAQSVGAGCRAAGTLSTQIRHMPGGGR